MKIIRIPSTIIIPVILAAVILAGIAAPASASLADSAGIWVTQPVEAVMVSPDGAKASADLGPARAAALGHLDSDGVIDLVVAYGGDKGAFAVVTLGDIRFRLGAHHDRERELDGLPPERPFATEGVVYDLPFVPHWAEVGDWDSDGDFDVVFAAQGWAQLFWMAGDGQGRLDAGRMIDLEGGVTAFVSGDVNRRDALDDLVVAINGKAGPALLVFEYPSGAFKADPERLTMPNVVTSLAVNWLDGDVWKDIAAASGNTVILVSGRDRKLVSTRAKQDAVPPAAMTPFEFGSKVLDVATGDFVGRDREAQLAVRLADGKIHLIRNIEREFEISNLGRLPVEGRILSARSSGLPGHDLLIADASAQRLQIFHAKVSKASGRKLEAVPSPDLPILSVLTGRLNVDSRDDLVLMSPDGTVQVAASKNRIAIVVDTTDDIDNGGCQYLGCSLREAIISANIQPSGSTITFDLPLGSTIEPTSALPDLTQSAATTIDGTVGSGMITGFLTLSGASAGNVEGLVVTGGNATIMNMIIRGFGQAGILLSAGDNNTVQGCRLGTDGTTSDGNNNGISVASGSDDNTIGGTAAGEGNTISGNQFNGISLASVDNTTLLGNLIGTNASGVSAVPNGNYGILANNATHSNIGSAISGGGNVISGNEVHGALLQASGTTGNALVIGNTIGLNKAKTAGVPNGDAQDGDGVRVNNENYDLIGGSNPATRNIISGNGDTGVVLMNGSSHVTISGNYIGTDGSGLSAIPNGGKGILLSDSQTTVIGGVDSGQGNLISGNVEPGVAVIDVSGVSSDLTIEQNGIGIASDGSALGNGSSGIYLASATAVWVNFNTIAHNGMDGLVLTGTGQAYFGANSIFDNGGLGIDLNNDGVTANDSLDADDGPNGLQNFPEILSVDDVDAGKVTFTLNSTPSTSFKVKFFQSSACDASGHGEGEELLGGTFDIETDASGTYTGQVTIDPVSWGMTPGAVLTATTTTIGWLTSEFSMCFTVPQGADHIFSDGFESGNFSQWSNVVGQ